MSFTVTLSTVAMMLLYAVPGYLLIHFRKLNTDSISSFATLLLYVCSPFQTVYAMQSVTCSAYMTKYLVLAFVLGAVLMVGMLGITYFIFRKNQVQVPYRICTVAAAMGNCGFMGIPLLEALLPDYPQAVAFASGYFLAMNILMWTLTSFIITRDRKFISLKRLINPSTIAMAISLVMYFSGITLTGTAADMVTVLAKMSTALCMLILGMRLAAVPLKPIFTNKLQYAAVGLKLIVFPLIALALCSILPVEREFAVTMYILCCVPTGNLVLSFSEILGEGQDTAANVVLLSTLLSMLTIPIMLLIV